jgi:Amt family ammonium transporter
MIYQLMFAIITPALITGAFAERMKFSAMASFFRSGRCFVYCPMAHMVWGVGGLLNATGGHFPFLDFAGGTVVHVTSGVSALVTCLYLGKRIGYPQTHAAALHGAQLHRRVPALGGLVRLQRRQRPGRQPLATSAFVNTHFAAAAAAIGWTVAEWIHNGKPTALGAISGAVAGLVAITPASGFVQPMSALAIGLIAGFFCFFMVFKSRAGFGYDDSLDAFGVHGAGGTLGALLTGLFATASSTHLRQGRAHGAIDGHWGQVLNQFAGVAIAWGISIVGTLVLLFVVDKLIGLRVSPDQEAAGLDLSQHGEEGYDLNS